MQSERRQNLFSRLAARENIPPWTAVTALLFVGAYIGVWLASLLVVSMLTGEIEGLRPSPRSLALALLVSGLVTVLGVVQWLRARFGTDWPMILRLRGPAQRNTQLVIFLVGLGTAWALDLAGAVLRLKGGEIVPPVLSGLQVPDATAQLLALVAAVITGPLVEGLVFGGLLYAGLTRVFADNRVLILAAALVYTIVIMLLSPAPATWYGLVQPFVMALALFGARAYYQSTRAFIIARAAFGLFFVLAAVFL